MPKATKCELASLSPRSIVRAVSFPVLMHAPAFCQCDSRGWSWVSPIVSTLGTFQFITPRRGHVVWFLDQLSCSDSGLKLLPLLHPPFCFRSRHVPGSFRKHRGHDEPALCGASGPLLHRCHAGPGTRSTRSGFFFVDGLASCLMYMFYFTVSLSGFTSDLYLSFLCLMIV